MDAYAGYAPIHTKLRSMAHCNNSQFLTTNAARGIHVADVQNGIIMNYQYPPSDDTGANMSLPCSILNMKSYLFNQFNRVSVGEARTIEPCSRSS